MRRVLAAISAIALVGCPSLDDFTGKEPGGSTTLKGFLSLADAARLCSKIESCPKLGYSIGFSLLLPVEGRTYSTCIDLLNAPLPVDQLGIEPRAKSLQCAAQAANCPAAAACMPYEYIEPTDPRCQGSTADKCSPDKTAVYRCSIGQITHCTNDYYYPGSTCLTDANGVDRCAAAETCTNTNWTCSGSIITFCAGGSLAYGEDCAFWGATCGKDQASGNQDCTLYGITPACSADSVQCVGDRVRACYGGFFSELDCGKLGGTCVAKPTAHCTRPPGACDLGDADIDTCSGNSIKLCVASKPQTFDCGSIGLKCVTGTNGAHCG